MEHSRQDSLLLKSEDIQVDPSSYVDPQGFLFQHNHDLFRCIRPSAVELFQDLLQSRKLDIWAQDKGLIPTAITNLRIEAEPDGMVLSHPRINPLTYCMEWCPGMLWEAARLTLDFAIELADHNLVLQDAYPWNILFDGVDAVFVDLTSIAPPKSTVLWSAHGQYESYFARPLKLMRQGKGRIVRPMLMNNIEGIDLETFVQLSSSGSLMRHPGVLAALRLERYLQSKPDLKIRARQMAEKAASRATPQIRKKFLLKLRDQLTSLRQPAKGDCWTNYYREIEADVDKGAKLSQVRRFLEKIAPKTVLDFGCNTGVFSIEAAKCGARVFSIDMSESCIDLLYKTASEQSLKITPIISDAVCPTPPSGFLSRQYPSLLERVKADTVLCLGLMHHLHINGRQSFERIAELMNEVSLSTLIFEFVGMDDANNSLLSAGREINYCLDDVIQALSRHFPEIETHTSDRPTRRLLVCRK